MVTEGVIVPCALFNCCQVMINNILSNKSTYLYSEKHEHLAWEDFHRECELQTQPSYNYIPRHATEPLRTSCSQLNEDLERQTELSLMFKFFKTLFSLQEHMFPW